MSKNRIAIIMVLIIIIQIAFAFLYLGLIQPINRVLYYTFYFGSITFFVVIQVLLKKSFSEGFYEVFHASPWLRVLLIVMICSSCVYLTLPLFIPK